MSRLPYSFLALSLSRVVVSLTHSLVLTFSLALCHSSSRSHSLTFSCVDSLTRSSLSLTCYPSHLFFLPRHFTHCLSFISFSFTLVVSISHSSIIYCSLSLVVSVSHSRSLSLSLLVVSLTCCLSHLLTEISFGLSLTRDAPLPIPYQWEPARGWLCGERLAWVSMSTMTDPTATEAAQSRL